MKTRAIHEESAGPFMLNGQQVHGSSAVLVQGAGSLLFVSGQTPMVSGVMPDDMDFESQVRQTLKNLVSVMSSAGGDLSNVVKLNAWVTRREDIALYAEVREEFFTEPPYPASTTVVGELVDHRMLIEIEAIAVI